MNLAACFLHVNKMQIRIVQEGDQMQAQQGQGKHAELAS
jgi:hypothetical protein